MKLSSIRQVGRYINPETGREVNVHKGRYSTRGVDILFWLYRGSRNYISPSDFYSTWVKVQ